MVYAGITSKSMVVGLEEVSIEIKLIWTESQYGFSCAKVIIGKQSNISNRFLIITNLPKIMDTKIYFFC